MENVDKEVNEMAYNLLLETSTAINLHHVDRAENGHEIATFVWNHLPHFEDRPSGEIVERGFKVKEGSILFTVDVDLTDKKVLKATNNHEQVCMADLVVFLAHYAAFGSYTHISATAAGLATPVLTEF